MAPQSNNKVVSDQEALEGNGLNVWTSAKLKVLTPEQRGKKQASDRKYRLNQKALRASLQKELEFVKAERDQFKGRLDQCEKELKEAKRNIRKQQQELIKQLRQPVLYQPVGTTMGSGVSTMIELRQVHPELQGWAQPVQLQSGLARGEQSQLPLPQPQASPLGNIPEVGSYGDFQGMFDSSV